MRWVIRFVFSKPLVFGLLTALFVGQPANAARSNIPFKCVVTGEKMLTPAMDTHAVCDKFAVGLSKDLGARLLSAKNVSGMTWISLIVRFSKPGIATASLTYSKNGKLKQYPVISVAVSDRAMNENTVEMLVRAVTDHAKLTN